MPVVGVDDENYGSTGCNERRLGGSEKRRHVDEKQGALKLLVICGSAA